MPDGAVRNADDDWADQDILTREEARERLAAEIASEQEELARLGESGLDPRAQAEIEARTTRLIALQEACAAM